MENSSDQEQDVKDNSTNQAPSCGSLLPRGLKEGIRDGEYCFDHSHNKHKGPSRIASLAIREYVKWSGGSMLVLLLEASMDFSKAVTHSYNT
ncbi:hypothetical protein Tco_0700151 [Tanacetum coccineum]